MVTYVLFFFSVNLLIIVNLPEEVCAGSYRPPIFVIGKNLRDIKPRLPRPLFVFRDPGRTGIISGQSQRYRIKPVQHLPDMPYRS